MNLRQRRRLYTVILIITVSFVAILLIMYALRQNINLFYTPTKVVNGEVADKGLIRLGGMVVKNSIIRDKDDLSVQFKLSDFTQSIIVTYKGILPDLFRESGDCSLRKSD